MPPKKIKQVQTEIPPPPPVQDLVQPVVPEQNKPKGKAKKVVKPIVDSDSDEEVNQVDWKTQFEQMIKFEKPVDPLDCKVDIPENYRCDFKKVQEGTLLYRPARIIVLNKFKDPSNSRVRNQDLHKSGVEADWNLGHDLISKQCWTADHYNKIEKVNATQLAHKLKEEVGDCLCKVEFTKSPDVSEMSNMIREGSRIIENAPVSDAEKVKMFKKLYERSQKGEYRIMRGYIIRSEDMQLEQNDIGMVKFLDADLLAKGEMAERLVNVKNIVSLTFRLTKYQLK